MAVALKVVLLSEVMHIIKNKHSLIIQALLIQHFGRVIILNIIFVHELAKNTT